MKKKVLLIATGGTIASHAGAEGLIPQLGAETLLRCARQILPYLLKRGGVRRAVSYAKEILKKQMEEEE